MKIEIWDIKKPIPYDRNPRVISDEAINQVANSISEAGMRQPIVVNKDGIIIVGHTRLKACIKLGHKEIPVHVADLTTEQERAYRVRDNKSGEFSQWDFEVLAIDFELPVLEEMGFDLSDEGLQKSDNDGLCDEDSAPDVDDKNVTSKTGDIWELGDHRLICGDSTDQDVVGKLMSGRKADLWITDPPYNVDYTGKTKDAMTIGNDSMADGEFREFLKMAYSCADDNMKEGACFYIWHADSEVYNFRGACADIGWVVRQCIIWNKSSMVLGRQDYHWKHEPCLYGWKGGAAHKWSSDRKQVTVLEFEKPVINGSHPTMKPVDLFLYQIKNNTNDSDIVLDSFGGSGTTMIACEKSGRSSMLVEYDPKYCDVIIKRWQEFTGKEAKHEDGHAFNLGLS